MTKRTQTSKGSGTQDASKRRKVDKKTSSKPSAAPKKTVSASDLAWNAVPLPDRLDDAEGFYGLEEIDDVEIVRPDGAGEIKFIVPENKSRQTQEDEEAVNDAEDAGDEWTGFDDDPEVDDSKGKESQEKPAPEVEKQQKQEAPRKENKKEDTKRARKEKEPKKGGIQENLSFDALKEDVSAEEEADVRAWEPLNLATETQLCLSKFGFTTPTPVQAACIPAIMDGHDVIGKASTGSGKTLAFAIPILEHYLEARRQSSLSRPIALILSPTRELAHQITKHITHFASQAPGLDVKVALLTGGLSVQKQHRLLDNADIVVGTPGRIWDVVSTGQGLVAKLKQTKFLVADEADRILSEGHFKEVEEILNVMDREDDDDDDDDGDDGGDEKEEDGSESGAKKQDGGNERQTLVFSATFHKGLQQKLAGKSKAADGEILDQKQSMEYLLKKINFREEKPKFIDVNPVSQMAENLKEGIVECPALEKDLYLYTTILYHPNNRALVFTNSISSVRRLTHLLQTLGLPALALHSSMAQKARLRSVERFSSPSSAPSSILIATDVAARGLDIKGIDMVIHYHVPRTADVYVHRSGRTARGSASGKSIVLCAPEEIVGVARLAAKIHLAASDTNTKRIPLGSLNLDRRVVSRVKPRATIAKKLTDHAMAREKLTSESDWLRNAAEDLGVEYDSEEFDAEEKRARGRGRGSGRHEREKTAGSLSQAEVAGLKAQLKDLLSKKINVGISERYVTSGRVDIDALLRGEGNQAFLGQVDAPVF